ncbi:MULTISPECIES: glycosyl hydrolase family 18 protein [unclassified Paenibacillus]|uniref:glycosyl hydrolase family 18 protein n=1 Tax=unclassified Paenibacillus TaxID=185978 RepID=UPI0024073942|nr:MULTISPECIES: glycosyl hydrolase family 18 protein [unclassified Paenibacillus]MDF9843023.1 spore germination protein [Paenibacillus sp. PastF-2]MDF9849765.1 spore germination protein [Paenibacillus sp. PastM-2]MDF9856318.1 spore germination protein [Paenibacillus sp. PastF-1]MDH6481589.1 spore germination protein [Paenibacillus sp. PastH-2]MDH6508871.1 spore germination protein [Paenibacillus sp. PastM-3]
MESRQRQGRTKKRGSRLRRFIGLVIIAAAAYWVVFYVLPNRQHTDPDWKGLQQPIFVKGQLTGYSASGTGDGLLLPLPLLQEYVDPAIRYEEATKSVILSTDNDLLYMQEDSTSASLNNEPVQLRLAPEEQDGVTYLPADSLEELYGLEVEEDSSTGAVLLMTAGESVPIGTVKGKAGDRTKALRSEATLHAPIVADMPPGTVVRIWNTDDEDEEWLYVQMSSGYAGYIKAEDITADGEKNVQQQEYEPTRAERSWKGKAVNLFWEAVYERKPNPANFGELPGINVVSPTWFSIVDVNGNVRSKADKAYVEWAHKQDMEVWALLSNSFDADLTTEALSSYERRMTTIVQMLEYADLYDLDGINIDFENVYTKDGGNVTQFMRELKPMAQAKNLIVSIDVTPKSNSEMWSLFLDRKALGAAADFLIVMAYDEHWASSPKAGSVASLPWVENSISRIIEEDDVPAEKLILGVPLYTRIWTETTENGETKVSSKAVGMKTVQELLAEKKLTPSFDNKTGQHYVEYKEDGSLHRIWIEDKVSLKARVELAKSFGLGGVASWTRSFGTLEAWEALQEISE